MLPPDRIRAITSNYFYWQGLRSVPFGLTGLVLAATWTPWWPAGLPREIAVLVAVGVAFAAFWWIGTYYDRAFGRVVGDADAHRTRSALLWWMAYPVLGASLVIDGVAAPKLFVSGTVWALAIVGYWWSTGRGRRHYLLFAPLTALFTIVPQLGFVAAGRDTLVPFVAWIATLYIVAGILDHRELARALSPGAAR